MKTKLLQFFIAFFIAATSAATATAADDDGIPNKPSPPRLVNNFSKEFPDFLSASEVSDLEYKLDRFSDSTSNQIAIVIVDDLNDMEPSQYATRLGEKWGVGKGSFNNGIVILVKPTGGQGQRKIFIATGRGLEGALPDITCKHIVDNEILPRFKNKDFYGGLNAATDVLISIAKGEYNSQSYDKKTSRAFPFAAVILIIFVVIVIFGRRRGGGMTMGPGGAFMAGTFFGGGFGGGSFGGGGSGGSW